MDELTLIGKILAEQQELAADLETFLETDKQIANKDIEAMQKQQFEIGALIQEIEDKQREVQNGEKN